MSLSQNGFEYVLIYRCHITFRLISLCYKYVNEYNLRLIGLFIGEYLDYLMLITF